MLSKVFQALFVVTISCMSLPDALAWGKFGHLTVCDLAYRNLTETSKEELKRLFRDDDGGIDVAGRGKMEDRHYTSFNAGCLEEDELPRAHPEDHFINVSRDTRTIEDSQCPDEGDCILSGISRDFEILKDASAEDEERVFALMALGHWVGDLHQPLHVSFADDRGGNSIDADLDGRCGSSSYRVENLHGVWDNCLLEAGLFERVRQRADYKKSWSKNTITYRAVDTLQANTSLAEEKAIVGLDPLEWANESYEITLSPETLYCVWVRRNCWYSKDAETFTRGSDKRLQAITQRYLKRFERIAEERVKRAGFRLAHLINLALDPAYREPIRNSTQR